MESKLVIGVVSRPHGIRGELKIMPYTDETSAAVFTGLKRVFLGEKEYRVLSVRSGADAVFLGVAGVPDRNAAELLRGLEVSVPRAEAPELPEGRYYISDLLGCTVSDGEEDLGVLTDVRQAATDVYTIERGGKEILFPAVRGVITEIDLINRRITVDKKRFSEVAVL